MLWKTPPLWKTLWTLPRPRRRALSRLPREAFVLVAIVVPSALVRSRRRFIVARAVVRETLPTLALAAGVTTFMLLIRALFMLAELLVSRGVSAATALRLLSLSVPNIVVLTIPIGVLFAALITSARWSADSELVAIQACGVRPTRIARPLLLLGVLLFAANFANYWLVVPRTNHALEQMTRRLSLSVGLSMLQAREFVENFQGYLLYVDRIAPGTGVWNGIVLFDINNPLEEQIVLARAGRFTANPAEGSATLVLEDATTHLLQPDHPERYRQNFNRSLEIYLRPKGPELDQRIRSGPTVTSSSELRARIASPDTSEADRREAAYELHKRVALPAAALVFVLVAFPLGIRNRRGGRGFGLTASVLVVMLYYVLLMAGEYLAASRKVPPAAGAWLPNLVLAGLASVLLLRARRAGGHHASQPAARAGWLRALRGRLARAPRAGRAPQPVARVRSGWTGQGRRLPSLGILDGYVIRTCLSFLVLVMLAVCVLWITVNLAENLTDISRNRPPAGVVASFYLLSLPQIFRDMLPLAFLIAFLGTTAVLERHNETTALKAAGVSLTRVTLPLLLVGLGLAVALFVLDDQITWRANRASQHLADIIKGKKVARSHRATDRLWLFLPDGRTLVNFMQFDPDTLALVRPSIFVFNDDMSLRTRHMARKAEFRDGRWVAEQAWSRTFLPEGRIEFVPPQPRPTELPLLVGQDYFGREYRKAAQMSFGELSEYIRNLRRAGYRVDRLRVQLHLKVAYPLTLVLLPWLSLSFAFQVVRRGTVMGIALALVLGMAYFAAMAFSTRLGEASLLPPLLAAWTPTVVFALLAVNRHTYLRT